MHPRKENLYEKDDAAAALTIIACAALSAPVWHQSSKGGKVPAESTVSAMSAECVEVAEAPDSTPTVPATDMTAITTEKEKLPTGEEQLADDTRDEATSAAPEPEPTEPQQTVVTTTTISASTDTTDPYHTDVYPNDVYSEDYTMHENGNQVGIME